MKRNLKLWSLNQELVDMFIGRAGGKTTSLILDQILLKPQNANQISKILELNYKTITHHTKILQEHDFLYKKEFNKTYYFHPTNKLLKHIDEYYIIKENLDLF